MTMKPEPLTAPFEKIERAKAQIEEFNTALGLFLKTAQHRITPHPDVDSPNIVLRFKLKGSVPNRLAVIAGEILHNIRTPLDQILAAVAVKHGWTQGDVFYPFGRNQQEFESQLIRVKKLPPDAIQMIKETKPYFSGGAPLLAGVHFLNKSDKHRVGLVPIAMRCATDIQALIVSEGRVLTVGPRKGRHFIRDEDNNLSQHITANQPRMEFVDGKAKIILEVEGPATVEDCMEIMTVTPTTKFEADLQPTFNVAFGDLEGFEREPVVSTLYQMRALVELILLTFERRFFF